MIAHQANSRTHRPLPWLPGIPTQLLDNREWDTYLRARYVLAQQGFSCTELSDARWPLTSMGGHRPPDPPNPWWGGANRLASPRGEDREGGLGGKAPALGQELLGHASVGSTDVYLHARWDDMRAAVDTHDRTTRILR